MSEALLQKAGGSVTDPALLAPVDAAGCPAKIPSAAELHLHEDPGRTVAHQKVDLAAADPQVAPKHLQTPGLQPVSAPVFCRTTAALREGFLRRFLIAQGSPCPTLRSIRVPARRAFRA